MAGAAVSGVAEDSARPFVRHVLPDLLPAPRIERGVVGWLHHNLFCGWFNSALSLVTLLALLYALSAAFGFFIADATFSGTAREDCLPHSGVCYPYLAANLNFFIYGFYPEAERWRVDLAALTGAAAIAIFLTPAFLWRRFAAFSFFIVFPLIAFILLHGGFGLPVVETHYWGGMIVTFVVAITGIVISLPLGILLALGRRSQLPVIKTFSMLFIELWRGVPLVTVLFMASVMLPLFVPADLSPDKLLRALIGVSLFSAAYMAEVVRGGLQAIPKGQNEAAMALGLNYWQVLFFVILPQALKKVIPGIVNSFIGLFKDTSLVFIVGLVDFLQAVNMSLVNPNWATPWTRFSGYVFAALFYFLCCWGMSRYSIFMERRLQAGEAR